MISEISLGRKKVFFILVYRSPNQTKDEFDIFYEKLQDTLDSVKDEKPHCIILTGDLNCRSKQWWPGDINSTEGMVLDGLLESNDLTQLIDQPTNIEPSGVSCVDLIITDQPSLFVDYGIHSSLDNFCHHQIIHGKVNVSVPSPPPYKRQVWDYSKANKEKIWNTLLNIDWSFKFLDLTVDEMTSVFTTSVMDIMLRYIPNKMIKCHDKDPPWITPEIKTAIKRKHRVYNKYVRRGRKSEEWEYVRVIRNETSKIITDAKETYFASLGRKLSNPAIGLKVYWSTFNKIINKKKMTNIPPLLENGIFVTNFQTKADIFNDLFVKQCSIHVNDSVLPNFISRCNLPLANIDIDPDKVLKIIRSLDCNKAHGWDNLSIAMIKICDVGIMKPLCLIYNKCLASGTFPEIWKKGNVIPVHKKESRQLKKNYRPISLLPICGKILEKIVFDVIYKHLTDNDLLTPNQSGFRPGDSTINQLLYITHKIYTAFEDYPSRETRAVFLDISKAFDKVWHDGLIFKLESYGIPGPLLGLINSYLANRYQRVVLNGKSSKWSPIRAGVPQGSVLGPLLFLVYINDLVDNISSDAKLFADDTSLFTVVYDENIAAEQLNRDLKIIAEWAYQWKMQFNPDVTKQAVQVIFSQKRDKPIHPPIYFNESGVVTKSEQKHLGMILDSSLNFQSLVREKIVSARRGIGVIQYMSRYVTREVLDQMYKLYVRPHLDYGDIIYHKYDPELNLDFTKKLEATQYSAALAVSGAWRGTNKYKLYEELGWESLYHRRWYRRLTHFFKLKNSFSPLYLCNLIPPEREIHYNLRAPRDYEPQIERTLRFSNTYFQNCIHEWNLLDVSTRSCQSISEFKRELLGRIRPPKRPTFNIYDIEGIKLLTRLRVEFSDLRNHRYRHNFHCPSPICLCQTGIEDNEHFLLHCPRFSSRRRVLLDLVSKSVKFDIMRLSSKELCNLLLYGHSKCTIITNRVIIELTLEYIKGTGRFKKK